ncbi:MAG TPA: hypothetical protein V6D17_19595 [Candidatus Obscuribacterales bacterium]
MRTGQLTIRGVPEKVKKRLQDRADHEKRSLNSLVVEALTSAAGLNNVREEFHDLDELSGLWIEDPEFDHALAMQEQIDESMWK